MARRMTTAASVLSLTLALLLLASDDAARAEVVVAGETKVPLYSIVDLTATLKDGKSGKNTQYRWKVTSGEPARVIRLGEGRILLSGPPGTYKLSVTVVDFDQKLFDEADVTVVIGGGPEPGPSPGPGPDPGPKPPAPADPLVKALKDAFAAEKAPVPEKAKHLEAFAALYRQAARMDLEPIRTTGELYRKLITASRAMLPEDAIPLVRRAANAEVAKALPDTTADLTAEQRQRASSTFARLGDALTEAGR